MSVNQKEIVALLHEAENGSYIAAANKAKDLYCSDFVDVLIESIKHLGIQRSTTVFETLVGAGDSNCTQFAALVGRGIRVLQSQLEADRRDGLVAAWNESEDPACKMKIIWFILDYGGFPDEMKYRFLRGVVDCWSSFVEELDRYWGLKATLSGVSDRLNQKAFDESKNWIYYCAALAYGEYSSDYESPSKVVDEDARHAQLDFNRAVSRFVLRACEGESVPDVLPEEYEDFLRL